MAGQGPLVVVGLKRLGDTGTAQRSRQSAGNGLNSCVGDSPGPLFAFRGKMGALDTVQGLCGLYLTQSPCESTETSPSFRISRGPHRTRATTGSL